VTKATKAKDPSPLSPPHQVWRGMLVTSVSKCDLGVLNRSPLSSAHQSVKGNRCDVGKQVQSGSADPSPLSPPHQVWRGIVVTAGGKCGLGVLAPPLCPFPIEV
jgi:hypothetical protein